MKSKILIPLDFSEVSDIAIMHATEFAKKTNSEIYLLHVIEKRMTFIGKNKEYDNQLIEKTTVNRLQKVAEDIETTHKLNVEIIVVPGNIFDTITAVASEVGASFVFMGTHGVKGIQHITGSYALKVIYHSSVPFILTQKEEPKKENAYKKIIFPIDTRQESAQKTEWAVYLAKTFDAEIHIVYPKETDNYLVRRINGSLNYVKKIFDKYQIKYNFQCTEDNVSKLSDDTNRYAEEIDADLIMIMIYPAKGAGEFFLTPSQQKVISNTAQIPVICINPGTLFQLKIMNEEI